MSGFGNYARRAEEIEREIFLRGLALGVNWDDTVRLRELARHALSCKPGCVDTLFRSGLSEDKLTAELFALSELMLHTMRQSAQVDVEYQCGQDMEGFWPSPVSGGRAAGRDQRLTRRLDHLVSPAWLDRRTRVSHPPQALQRFFIRK